MCDTAFMIFVAGGLIVLTATFLVLLYCVREWLAAIRLDKSLAKKIKKQEQENDN